MTVAGTNDLKASSIKALRSAVLSLPIHGLFMTTRLAFWLAGWLVGVPRFELGTSRTRTVRSTGLSHTPHSPHIIPDLCHRRYGFNNTS